MIKFAQTADWIAATTKKLEKTALLAKYFKSVPVEEATVAAVFFSGRPFPAWEETTLQVGGRLLWRIVEELSGKNEQELTVSYREHGDLGAVAGAMLPDDHEARSDGRQPRPPTLIQQIFLDIAAARGPAAKGTLIRELFSQVTPPEAKYIIKIMTGDLRIGLKESLVEEAIAKAFGGTVAQVQRANMLLGDIGETLRLAAESRLGEAKMRLFHPIGFMLASPAESAEDALSYFQQAWIEDKYDGIRAQAHCSGDVVKFFSRTRDEITESFPELPDALVGLTQDAILDGEILAWSYSDPGTPEQIFNERVENEHGDAPVPEERNSLAQHVKVGEAEEDQRVPEGRQNLMSDDPAVPGRALPFSALQQRLGRKKVSYKLMGEVPVAYLVFDVLYAGGELVIDKPLRERATVLDGLFKNIHHREHRGTRKTATESPAQPRLCFEEGEVLASISDQPRPVAHMIRAPVSQASSPEELNRLFDAAQARGNEGLMIKDRESPYTPGRRGKSWLKLKRELATLDVVVTAVEYGHGRRIGVLSDYTFAVRDGERLLNIGKAYSGLTDAEILDMTKWFLEHTIKDQGFRREVEPKIVLEVAFNNIMKSDRHASGFALRFPRIVRLRQDKLAEEADTMERVREVWEKQHK